MNDTLNAAHNLTGRVLKSGWEVIEKIPTDTTTGGFFSVCYKVQKQVDGKTMYCFLKAFDFLKFFNTSSSNDTVDVMAEFTNAFIYERDISKTCRDNHVTKILPARDAGEEYFPECVISRVPYLIFDLASGDVRQRIFNSEKCGIEWKFRSLHSVAVGIKQLHYIMISHQDIKPSNILVLDDESLLGDLGRSQSPLHKSPFNDDEYSGDWGYAPPEILYGSFSSDWKKRAFAIDLYLLGNLAVFYFTGFNISTLLYDNIPSNFHWRAWRGSFDQVEEYLVDGFSRSIGIIKDEIIKEIGDKELSSRLLNVIMYLCHPLPDKRGHPKTNLNFSEESLSNPYNLERIISEFNLLRFRSHFICR